MKRFLYTIGTICALATSSLLSNQRPTSAQTCHYFAGAASTGQSINVDLCSISNTRSAYPEFAYYLGSERVFSQANCPERSWITFPERQVHYPQSSATSNMMSVVCSYRASSSTARAGVATVFEPPSNVRVSPNGTILCSVRQRSVINIYGSTGSWYYTDVCGTMGVIDISQLQF